jgi:glutamate synthase (ferredoxin)
MFDFKAVTVSTLYDIEKGVNGFGTRIRKAVTETFKAVSEVCNIVIISDRGVTNGANTNVVICSYIHHSPDILKSRSKFGIIIESAEPREPHHFALLFMEPAP